MFLLFREGLSQKLTVQISPGNSTQSNIQSVIEEFKEEECVPANLLINSGGVRFSSTARLLEHLAPRQLAFCGFIASECERFGSLACPSAKKLLARVSTKEQRDAFWRDIHRVLTVIGPAVELLEVLADNRTFFVDEHWVGRWSQMVKKTEELPATIPHLINNLNDLYGSWKNRDLWEIYGLFHPAIARVRALKAGSLPTLVEQIKQAILPIYTDEMGSEYATWIRDPKVSSQVSSVKEAWQDIPQDDYPCLKPLVQALLSIPLTVTSVDRAFSSLDVIASNKRRRKQTVEGLARRAQLFINKDIGNVLSKHSNADTQEEEYGTSSDGSISDEFR